MPHTICTERATTTISDEAFHELVRRIRAAGRDDVADELIERHAFDASNKAFVFGVLDEWLDDVKFNVFQPMIGDLRYELDWDLGNRG